MSIDLVSLTDTASGVVNTIILILVIYRGIAMSRAFVSRVYRRRAAWIDAVVSVALLVNVVGYVPFLNSAMVGAIPLVILVIVALALCIFVYVDNTIGVTLEMDFFHRNTLRWRQVRLIAYPLLFGIIAINLLFGELSSLPSSPSWVSAVANSTELGDLTTAMFALPFSYAIAALIIGARRTPDQTMKRHVRLLGLAVALYLLQQLIGPYSATVSIDLLNDFLRVATPFLVYFAVMALSPISRIENDSARNPTRVPQAGAPMTN